MKTNYPMEAQIMNAIQNGILRVDPDGKIWRLKKRGWDQWKQCAVDRPCKVVRAENKSNFGYLQIRTMLNKVRAQVGAHRIVFRSLVGPIPAGLTINHKNGIKWDNRPENLELATYSEQAKHCLHVLRKNQRILNQDGQANHHATLSDQEVEILRAEYSTGKATQEALGRKYGIAFQTVSRIVRGEARRKQGGVTADYTARRSSLKRKGINQSPS